MNRLLLSCVIILSSVSAYATAWVRPIGTTEMIAQISNTELKYPGVPNYSGVNPRIQLEHGLSNSTTVGTKFSYNTRALSQAPGVDFGNDKYYNDLYIKQKIYEKDIFAVSFQPGIRRSSGYDYSEINNNLVEEGSITEYSLEGRTLFGIAYPLFNKQISYFGIEPAIRQNVNNGQTEYIFDANLGIRFTENFGLVVEYFDWNAKQNQFLQQVDDYESYKLMQISTLHKVTDNLAFQIGTFFNVNKRNQYKTHEFMLGLWYYF